MAKVDETFNFSFNCTENINTNKFIISQIVQTKINKLTFLDLNNCQLDVVPNPVLELIFLKV